MFMLTGLLNKRDDHLSNFSIFICLSRLFCQCSNSSTRSWVLLSGQQIVKVTCDPTAGISPKMNRVDILTRIIDEEREEILTVFCRIIHLDAGVRLEHTCHLAVKYHPLSFAYFYRFLEERLHLLHRQLRW